MKPVISKEDVANAIGRLVSQGKKPTLAAIHAALENRGSMSTLVRLKAEIDAETQRLSDSPEALAAFRNVWASAREEGRNECQQMLAEMQETLQTLAAENERICGTLAAKEQRFSDLEKAKAKAEADLTQISTSTERDLSRATSAITEATMHSTKALHELAESRAEHSRQIAALQSELTKSQQTAHDLELQLARAQALLDAGGHALGGVLESNQRQFKLQERANSI